HRVISGPRRIKPKPLSSELILLATRIRPLGIPILDPILTIRVRIRRITDAHPRRINKNPRSPLRHIHLKRIRITITSGELLAPRRHLLLQIGSPRRVSISINAWPPEHELFT